MGKNNSAMKHIGVGNLQLWSLMRLFSSSEVTLPGFDKTMEYKFAFIRIKLLTI